MNRFGALEIVVILVVVLLLFGAGRIADIGKGLGEGIKQFKKGIKEDEAPAPPPKAEAAAAKKEEDEKPA